MTYEELQKCILPVEVINIEGKQNLLTAYNNAGFLITCKETGDWIFPWEDLDTFKLKPKITPVKLYKYNYYDKMLKGTFSTKWTTEGFSQYFNAYDDLELRSTEVKTVEIEE